MDRPVIVLGPCHCHDCGLLLFLCRTRDKLGLLTELVWYQRIGEKFYPHLCVVD